MTVDGYFRSVRDEDADLLFAWANDPVTRQQSFSHAEITRAEHEAWFARRQGDPGCHHFILMAREDGAAYPAGVLRLQRDGRHPGVYTVSYSVAPAWRGRGCGSLILLLALRLADALPADCAALYGEVREENTASLRCFEKAGYRRTKRLAGEEDAPLTRTGADGIVCFRKEICPGGLIYFRADANAQVGRGHLMRCLTIADACAERGLRPVFLTADARAADTAAERGYPCAVLHTDYRRMEDELPILSGLLRKKAPIVLDSYFLTCRYVEALRAGGHQTVWLDDLGKERYPAELLINYNLYAGELGYPAASGGVTAACVSGSAEARRTDDEAAVQLIADHGEPAVPAAASYLLGPAYAPVRPGFCVEKPDIRAQLGTVLVLTGAGDPCGAGAFFAKKLAELLPGARILAVCGPYAAGREQLYALAKRCDRIKVLEGINDLSGIMRESDFAVSAAGSTVYELCAAGVPAAVYSFADNQRQGAEAFARLTGSVDLGDIREAAGRKEAGMRLRETLLRCGSVSTRRALSEAMRGLTDGRGAERIAGALAELVFEGQACYT